MPHYGDGEEMLFRRNPKGGRPMGLAHTVFQGSDTVDIQGVTEESHIRYHLGYCRKCGERIVIGSALAAELVSVLAKKGIGPKEAKEPWSLRLAKHLVEMNKRKGIEGASMAVVDKY